MKQKINKTNKINKKMIISTKVRQQSFKMLIIFKKGHFLENQEFLQMIKDLQVLQQKLM